MEQKRAAARCMGVPTNRAEMTEHQLWEAQGLESGATNPAGPQEASFPSKLVLCRWFFKCGGLPCRSGMACCTLIERPSKGLSVGT